MSDLSDILDSLETPRTTHHTPHTRHHAPHTARHAPRQRLSILNPIPSTLNTQHSTLNTPTKTLSPKKPHPCRRGRDTCGASAVRCQDGRFPDPGRPGALPLYSPAPPTGTPRPCCCCWSRDFRLVRDVAHHLQLEHQARRSRPLCLYLGAF